MSEQCDELQWREDDEALDELATTEIETAEDAER
jgi:hypothetical protein